MLPQLPVGARRSFVISDDGLLEQSTPSVDGQQRSLFAYRATAGSMAPARFPPSPIEDAALSPLRPRSYTFSKAHRQSDAAAATAAATSTSSSSAAPPPASTTSSSPGDLGDGVAGCSVGQSPSSVPLPPPGVPFTPAQALQSLFANPAPASGVISVDGVPVKAKACACKKSQCLKLYCECFAHGRVCVDCNCVGCHNTDQPEHQHAREKAIQATRDRDANAFYRAAPLKAKAEAIAAEVNAAAAQAASASISGGKQSPMTDTAGGDIDASPTRVKQEPTASAPSSTSTESGVGGVGADGAASSNSATAPAAVGATVPGSGGGGGGDGSGGGGAVPSAAAVAASARKGCNCRKSRCLKKYCECYQLGLKCTARCKCEACANGKEHSHEEGGASGEAGHGGKEQQPEQGGKVKGVFVNVPVESHHAQASATSASEGCSSSPSTSNCSSSSSSPSSSSAAAGAAPSAALFVGRDDGGAGGSKLSTWKLLPSGSAAAAAPGSLLHSNAPPIPVTALGPFTLPAPFELFHLNITLQPHTSRPRGDPAAAQKQPADAVLSQPLPSLSGASSFMCELGEEDNATAVR